jgi:hypothetical protein
MSNKYEQLVEFIINDETDKARELFHKIVVEKSRDIYESLVSEEDLEETIGGNEVEDMVRDVQMDEEGISEEEEFGDDEEDSEEDEDGAFDHDEGHEEAGEEELEDRVVDLESALDELKAEFDALMADEQHEPEHHDGVDDPNFGGEEDMMYESVEDDEEDDEEEDDEEDLEEGIVREYVENVGTPYKGDSVGAEGKFVGNDGRRPINAKATVASKNDMGGSAKNIATGKANGNPDGNSPAKEGSANAYKKGEGKLPHAGQFKNVAGSKKVWDGGADKQWTKKETETGKLAGNDGSRPVGKTPVIKTTPR